jgi:predicted acetyltransferase
MEDSPFEQWRRNLRKKGKLHHFPPMPDSERLSYEIITDDNYSILVSLFETDESPFLDERFKSLDKAKSYAEDLKDMLFDPKHGGCDFLIRLKNTQGISDCGLRISECIDYQHIPKSEIHNPKSEIHNPKPTIRNPHSEIHNPKSEIHNPKSYIGVVHLFDFSLETYSAQSCTLGFAIAAPFRRKRYATEAMQQLIYYAHTYHQKKYFLVYTDKENEPSNALVQSLNMVLANEDYYEDDYENDETDNYYVLKI